MLNRILCQPRLLLFIMVGALGFAPVLAQESPEKRGWLRGTFGYSKSYLDEPGDLIGGGSVGIHLTPKWVVEPEVSFATGKRYQYAQIAANLIYRLGDIRARVAAYPILGIGYLREVDNAIDYSRDRMALYGGFGASVQVSGGFFIAPEARVGNTGVRFTVSLGYSF